MTRFALIALALTPLLLASPAQAKGRKDPAIRDQIKTMLSDFRTQRRALQDQIKAAGQTYLDGVAVALQLDEAGIDALETQLDAAWELAEDRFEALDDADQLPATLRSYILEELKKVTDAATADAAIQAQLDALSTAFVDAVLPVKAQLSTLRSDTRAAIKALLQ